MKQESWSQGAAFNLTHLVEKETNMKTTRTLLLLGLALSCATRASAGLMVDFEDIPLAPESNFHGPVPGGVEVEGPFGTTVVEGSFSSGGVQFVNRYNLDWGTWSSFAVTNETDTIVRDVFSNPFSAIAGSGANGSENYGVAFGYDDLVPNNFDNTPFDRFNLAHLRALPSLVLPGNVSVVSAMITNTTYAALTMLQGDGFSKKFGGDSGNDPDYLRLSVYGIDASNQALTDHVEFYLADFRFANNSQDYILDEWTQLDLTALSEATSLHFNLDSSDVGADGMNAPGYFAIDNLQADSAAVPEPSALLLITVAGLTIGGTYRRKRAARASSAAEQCE